MNWEQAKVSWAQLKGHVKAKWSNLTDDDLELIAGKRDQLISKIQERYGIAKEDAEKQVAQWDPVFGVMLGADPKSKRKVG